jgi:orotate phosphoribosyltransferase
LTTDLKAYQKDFIDFLISSNVLTFGDFTLKSGRRAPYFINAGNLNTGRTISETGRFYARHLVESRLTSANVIFGPSYKGIPLSVATAISLSRDHSMNIGFSFDRKEAKDHGEGGLLVGQKISGGSKVVIVEDVVTAGTTFQKIVPLLRALGQVEIIGAIVAVDRCERGTQAMSAVQEIKTTLGVPVHPIITIHSIVEYLGKEKDKLPHVPENTIDRIKGYLAEYGV